jgi:hypothetical protein
MQRVLAVLAFSMIPSFLLAQDAAEKINVNSTPPPIVKPSRDFLMVDFGWNNWQQKPDSVKTKGFGYQFNAYLCYDFPIRKTKLSFAAGLGISTNVTYLNQEVMRNTDTASATANQVRFVPDTAHFKRYKFVTTYLTAPFELRYFGNSNNRNKGFKAAIGLEVGTLLGGHTKAVTSVNGTNVKYKVDTKRYITPWNFAATARVGWGNFSVFGSYNLTNVFKENAGPPITPITLGLCFTGL